MPTLETASTFTGIDNENGFFGQHYLAEVFQGDIRDQVDAWEKREDGVWRAPQDVLAGLGARWFLARKALVSAKGRDAVAEAFTALQRPLLAALGYKIAPAVVSLVDGYPFVVWAKAGVAGLGRAPRVLIVPVIDAEAEGDLLEQPVGVSLFPGGPPTHAVGATWADWLTDGVFSADDPPRFVLLLGTDDWLLLDALKWANNRRLRFTWSEILDRKEKSTLEATAALLHHESLAPAEGAPLLDGLDERAHKHAFGVSEDLKYALRAAIELLGNEAATQLRAQAAEKKLSVFSGRGELDAGELSLECLRLMYRLLFIFYIEARPDLNYVPIKSEAYLKGYSLEALRDLELVELDTPRAREGHFFDASLRRLFRLVHEGSGATATPILGDTAKTVRDAFALAPLDSRLFDPAATPLLNEVRFPNHVWQKVVELLSLTKPRNGRIRRGRVSYQLLSINQLGAVYEALLSFRGFFAKEDLFEVQPASKKGNRATPVEEEADGSDADIDGDADEDADDNELGEGGGRGRRNARRGQLGRDDLEVGWFVPQSRLDDYTDDERVYVLDEQGHRKLRTYTKGTFIYRLAGRDREKSASYYTPQVLTQCLVKYALKELLRDGNQDELKADDVLRRTVVEPAMGSAAFLNEAVNQLAAKYLEKKQAETGQRIPHDRYPHELQRVRMYIADRNVFGVDLNPVAVELAEVSLWLNAICGDEQSESGRPKPVRVPWFGYQLFEGNSLIGARAGVYAASALVRGAKPPWHEQSPRRLVPKQPDRRPDEIYHFLLPDPGMVAYKDKTAKALYPHEFEHLRTWRGNFCAPLEEHEIARLQQLSQKIDGLWAEHTQRLARDRAATEDRLSVWPGSNASEEATSRAAKDAIRREGLLNEDSDEATPYRRLKLVMDYWCALWFWPIRHGSTLPTRAQWWIEIGAILEGNIVELSEATLPLEPQVVEQLVAVAPQQTLPEMDRQPSLTMRSSELHDRFGRLRITKLQEVFPRISEVQSVAKRRRFLHWELAFADIFRVNGGFDLVAGNPPWIKVEWNEDGILGEANPLFAIRGFTGPALSQAREVTFAALPGLQEAWIAELEEASGLQNFLNAQQNYPLLHGLQSNLYKCFIPLGWMLGGDSGVSGLLHEDGPYDEPEAGQLRTALYHRLRLHFGFVNEKRLFPEVHHEKRYSINVYGPWRPAPNFDHIANLFVPSTIDACYSHDGAGALCGYKTADGKWNTDGHSERIVHVDEKILAVFGNLYDESGTPPIAARLAAVHGSGLVAVLAKLADYPRRLASLDNEDRFNTPSTCWHESGAQRNGTIKPETRWPEAPNELILTGPIFYVATPLYKTPRAICTQPSHYDVLHLQELPDSYVTRTVYSRACPDETYRLRAPRVGWKAPGSGEHQSVLDVFRHANREMIGPARERTLVSAIIPPGSAHVHTVLSNAFRKNADLLDYHSFCISLAVDYLVKSTGAEHANPSLISQLPMLSAEAPDRLRDALYSRALALNCLTSHYAPLWDDMYRTAYNDQMWSQPHNVRLPHQFFRHLTRTWSRHCALRSDYSRRLALIEIDVLVAHALGLTLSELLLIYRVQFPTLQQYEVDTWYDINGQIVSTKNRGLPAVGLAARLRRHDADVTIRWPNGQVDVCRWGWDEVRRRVEADEIPEGTMIEQSVLDDTQPGGATPRVRSWTAPFDRSSREREYGMAWDHFARLAH